jgi:hypothetical protein
MSATVEWVRGVAVKGRRIGVQRQLHIPVRVGAAARAAAVHKPCPKGGIRNTTNRRGLWLQSTLNKTVWDQQLGQVSW